MRRHVVICAGESSGDALGAGLVRELAILEPEVRYSGMGGAQMRDAGVETLIDVEELAVVGLVDVLVNYPRLRRLFRRMGTHLEHNRPDLLVLVDYVEFNLRLAAHARRLGIPVLFYVSPQLWAWRSGRIRRIQQCVDAMAVLFPFETEIYERAGVPVRYVGNPLVDRVQEPTVPLAERIAVAEDERVIGLLPGSRSGELKRHWPLLVEAARRMHGKEPALRFVVALAPGVDPSRLDALAPRDGLPISFVSGEEGAHALMAGADLLLIASGTATLEAGLLQAPMLVFYRMGGFSHAVFSRLVRLENIALVNIVAGERLVPEYLQRQANPERLASDALDLLRHPERLGAMRESLASIRERLGDGGADRRIAEMARELLNEGRLSDY
ncbi:MULTISPECIES: lipid-A-disaccharide synthase [unclassified Thioalkalivibrio]|uniref:lipid-A-disaccharide synthase n=1 Tax=unclassified Thioalkalivibrio TaxID=2621013 RepID=UPI0003613630|nr:MULTISPECIES: lipid-A-disaccharide synthase [unclassified Thioalkalivibrio]